MSLSNVVFPQPEGPMMPTVSPSLMVNDTPSTATTGPNDLHIAAHAKAANLTLVSNNVKEFERVEGLQLENWI